MGLDSKWEDKVLAHPEWSAIRSELCGEDVAPHALKLTYTDGKSSWMLKEVIVYAEGYNKDNAVNIGYAPAFAHTSGESVIRFAKYLFKTGTKISGITTPEKQRVFSELCWHINNGIGHCRSAPEHLKEYMRRLDIEV